MNYLTLDIGGSSIKYALLNETGEFIEKGVQLHLIKVLSSLLR